MNLAGLLERAGTRDYVPAFLDSALAVTAGAFHLPQNAAVIGLRSESRGLEVKLEVLVECLPAWRLVEDGLRAQLAERPAAGMAFQRWCDAMSPGQHGIPGQVSVVSIRVGGGKAAALNIYVRPSAIQAAALAVASV
jgi:hypothetical protein